MTEINSKSCTVLIAFDLFDTISDLENVGHYSRTKQMIYLYSLNFNKIYLLTSDKKKYIDLPSNVEHINFYNIPFNKYLYFLFGGILNFKKDVDIVEIWGTSAIITTILYKIFNKKILLYHRWDFEKTLKNRIDVKIFGKIINLIAFNMVDGIAVTTSSLRKDVIKYSNKNTVLIPNFVDVDKFYPLQIKKVSNQLIFTGRLHTDKNIYMLLDVMNKLPDYKLIIIGDGPLREDLKKYIINKNINNVFLYGVIPHDLLPNYFCSSDAFILLSHIEGHPKALIEAMACGLPCIGTNVEGIKDVIIDNENGYLCEKNVDDVVNKILKLFNDKDIMKNMSLTSRNIAVNNYSMDVLINQKISFIIKMIEKRL